MTDAEKIAAFDLLAVALVNEWADGKFGWWNPTPCGGESRDTPGEALADLVAWADRIVKIKAKKRRTLEVIRERGHGHAPTIGADLPDTSGSVPGSGGREQAGEPTGTRPADSGG